MKFTAEELVMILEALEFYLREQSLTDEDCERYLALVRRFDKQQAG